MGGILSNSPPNTTSASFSSSLPPPLSIKVNKGFQQRANEHGPLSGDAYLCCLPPRTLLVYLGCQVKGRLREGETFFFNKAGLVSLETAGQHYRDNDKRAKSGLRASYCVPHCCWRHFVFTLEKWKSYLDLFSLAATRLRPFTVGGEINESIFTPSPQLGSGAKR